jgi:AcrR family transcriptional regulator
MVRYEPGMDTKPYHHGDLRAALLGSAEAELAEHGIEAFSLRQVAKRAGVSHAAPAHHFGDANGLLTALAAEGFRQFGAMQAAREAVADRTPRAQMIAAGLGYVDFAIARPALFRLMHSSDRPAFDTPDLGAVAKAAYDHLCGGLVAIKPDAGVADIGAVWATAHGLADLISAGRLSRISSLPAVERDAVIADIIGRALP